MTLLVQHGHAKSDKIDAALESETVDGVIFGARNEKVENINACIDNVREHGGHALFDPQFHLSAMIPASDRFLPDYPYYRPGRTTADFVGMRRLASYAKEALDFEMTLGVHRLLSPTVIFDSFDSNWSQTALNLADASLEYHAGLADPPPLLLSFVLGEAALESRTDLDRFLDQVTSWESLAGAYIVVSREDSSYSQRFEPIRFANALYMTHVLGHINGLEVINGYSDFCGLLYRSVGGAAFATGWSQSQRQFHRRSFTKHRPGGQPPRLRYTSTPLLNSILLSELQQIFESECIEDVLSGVPMDNLITNSASPEAADWNLRASELHHWECLHLVDESIGDDVAQNIAAFEERIATAQELYVELSEEGVVFALQSRPDFLDQWSEALAAFRGTASL